MRLCVRNSVVVMHMQEKTVKTAGQNYIVQAAVLQMRSMQVVLSVVSMSQVVNFSENVWNVRS